MGLPVTAFAAESAVRFENGKLIAFEPGSIYTDSDLFDNFKGLMPGDTRTEKVTIQNRSADCDYIKVYLRAVLNDEAGNPVSEKVLEELRKDERRGESSELSYMYDFLSQLSMTVKNGTKEIYNASLDQSGNLTENVYVGTLRKDESLQLDLELNVPIELSSEYANRVGEVDWVFVVEGFDDPVPPSQDNNGAASGTGTGILIQTGQLNWPIPVMGGLGLALIAYGFFVILKKRKNERE